MNESRAEKKKEPKLALRREAAALYEKAAQQEHPWACFELAKMYADGKTIPQDLVKAYRLIQAARLLFARDSIYFDSKKIAEVEAGILRDPNTKSMLQESFAKGAAQLGVQAISALPAPQGGAGKQGPARNL